MLENESKIHIMLLIVIISMFLMAGCVQPEPTPSPETTAPPTQQPTTVSPTTVPPTTTPAPTTNLVNMVPQQLILKTDQFPLSGYSVTADEAFGEDGWRRTFESSSESSEYWWVDTHVYLFDALPGDAPSASACGGWEGGEISVVDAPVVGDNAIACKITFASTTPVLKYYVYTRNVLVVMDAAPKDASLPDDQVLDFLVALSQYQIVLIDRASPPGPVITTTETPKFQFNAPSTLAATAGKDFKYSFCDPEPATPTSPCGPIPATKNPSGGNPSYHFVLGAGTGFPPFSLSLSKDGVLKGKVSSTEAGKTRTIEVCAIDLNADAVCRKVTITVNAGLPDCSTALQGTTWDGTFKIVDSNGNTRYTATFEFTFGQGNHTSYGNLARAYPDRYGGVCDVPIASATVNDPAHRWILDAKAADPRAKQEDLGLNFCGLTGCESFSLIFGLPGGPGVSEVGGGTLLKMDSSGEDIGATTIRGSAGTGSYGGGCCWAGSFTANRR